MGHYEGVKWVEMKTFSVSDPEFVIRQYLEMFSNDCTLGMDRINGTAEVGPYINPTCYGVCTCDECVGMAAENLMQRARTFHFAIRNNNVLKIITIAKRDAAKAKAAGRNASDAFKMTAATLTSSAVYFYL